MGSRLALSLWWACTEREEVVGVSTNDATWRRSCVDDHMTMLNTGGWWWSNGEMVLDVRRRD
jgi:hypothetical protein